MKMDFRENRWLRVCVAFALATIVISSRSFAEEPSSVSGAPKIANPARVIVTLTGKIFHGNGTFPSKMPLFDPQRRQSPIRTARLFKLRPVSNGNFGEVYARELANLRAHPES